MTTTNQRTLAIDIGGTGIKAAVLHADGTMDGERQRVATTYPMPPDKLINVISGLAAKLPPFDRASAGFPGVVREGRVLTAPHFVTKSGPGTEEVPALVAQWDGFDLTGALAEALRVPVRVANDADLQGSDVISGKGLELVVTLGTGVGTGLFYNGHLAPHLEIAHHPFEKGRTYNEAIGEAARRQIGKRRWNRRVKRAIRTLDALINYDHLYIGGGNSGRVKFKLDPDITIVDNDAGLLGGIKLWQTEELGSTRSATAPPTKARPAAKAAPAPARRPPVSPRRTPSGRTPPPRTR
ncbi:MAG TPA: ROK family protein [Acidimicrobiales bacterium]|nr:ROK family protein [Acidimicrobiales bacterium]